jgi:cytochrome c oxidase subunit 2
MKKALILSLMLMLNVWVLAGENQQTQGNTIKVGDPPPADAPVKEVEVSAKKYEYSPAVIEVPLNTLVKIHLKATDREHGFEIKAFKGSCVKFKPNEPATVEFYVDKAAEYDFNCCKFCGMGHSGMKGKLVVK